VKSDHNSSHKVSEQGQPHKKRRFDEIEVTEQLLERLSLSDKEEVKVKPESPEILTCTIC
jgi:hypothetical protein